MYNKVTKRKNHILIHFLSLAFVAWCIVVFIEARYAYDDRTMFEGIVISVSYLYPFPLLLSSFLFGRYQAITEHKNYFWVGQRVISYYFIVGSLISNWFFRLKNISISFEMVWIGLMATVTLAGLGWIIVGYWFDLAREYDSLED